MRTKILIFLAVLLAISVSTSISEIPHQGTGYDLTVTVTDMAGPDIGASTQIAANYVIGNLESALTSGGSTEIIDLGQIGEMVNATPTTGLRPTAAVLNDEDSRNQSYYSLERTFILERMARDWVSHGNTGLLFRT